MSLKALYWLLPQPVVYYGTHDQERGISLDVLHLWQTRTQVSCLPTEGSWQQATPEHGTRDGAGEAVNREAEDIHLRENVVRGKVGSMELDFVLDTGASVSGSQ